MAFQREYNDDRPHEALGQQPPGRIYRPSPRPYPNRLPEVEYPAHYEVRRVGSGGLFSWHQKKVFVSHSLRGELIGMVEIEDGLWRMYYSMLELGILNEAQIGKRTTGIVLPMSPV